MTHLKHSHIKSPYCCHIVTIKESYSNLVNLASKWSNSSRNAKKFFYIGDPPSSPGLEQPSSFFQIFDNVLSIFNLSWGKIYCFHKSPPLVVLTPKILLVFFSTKSLGGLTLIETFHQKIFFVIYAFPKYNIHSHSLKREASFDYFSV